MVLDGQGLRGVGQEVLGISSSTVSGLVWGKGDIDNFLCVSLVAKSCLIPLGPCGL